MNIKKMRCGDNPKKSLQTECVTKKIKNTPKVIVKVNPCIDDTYLSLSCF